MNITKLYGGGLGRSGYGHQPIKIFACIVKEQRPHPYMPVGFYKFGIVLWIGRLYAGFGFDVRPPVYGCTECSCDGFVS